MASLNAQGMMIDLAVGGILLLAGLGISGLHILGYRGWFQKGRTEIWLAGGEWLLVASLILVPAGAIFAPWVCLILAIALLLRPALEFGLLQRALQWATGQGMLSAGLLAGALVLVFGPGALDAWELDRQAREAEQRVAFDMPPPKLSESAQTFGVTTSGQAIPFFAAETDPDRAIDENIWLDQGDWGFRVIRMADANLDSNCHGHVFGHDRHWILGRHVEVILRENLYNRVEPPAEGDVVIYRKEDGSVSHTGIVRGRLQDGAPLVESKWGSLGIYLHPATDCPYGRDDITYYRHPTKTSHHLDLGAR